MFKKDRLAQYLQEHRMTQTEFGRRVGTSEAMVNYLVKGYKAPSIGLLRRIANEMGCTMDELVE